MKRISRVHHISRKRSRVMHKHLVCGIAIGLLVSLSAGAEQTRQLGGRVIDESGQSLGGAKVLAFKTESKTVSGREDRKLGAVVTGADGRFTFEQWPEASLVTIVATKEGRCLDWAFWSGRQTDEPVLQLGPAATIEGEIVGEDGKPVGGASVDALFLLETPRLRQMPAPLPGNVLTVRTDAQGRFRFVNVPKAAIVGFDVSAPTRARVFSEPRFMPGQKGLRFVLPPEGRLEGVVVDKGTGQPLADVCLLAVGSRTSGRQFARAKTDHRGRFSMAGLSGGKYDIKIVGHGKALPEWLGELKKVQVETGKATSTIKIEASRGGTLELSLTDAATGESIAAAAGVHVSPAEDRGILELGIASKEGVARFYLAPGNYVVTGLFVTSYLYKLEKGRVFRVEAGKTERATLALTATPHVAGIVRDLAGKPVPGAKVQVLPTWGTAKNLIADDDGRFMVDSADIGPLFCFILVRHPRQNLVAMEVVEKSTLPLEITLRPSAKVSGTVLDSQGRPVSGASVRAQIHVPHCGRFATVATVRTDKNGRYQMELAGTSISYAIIVKAPGFGTTETIAPQYQRVQGPTKAKDQILRAVDRMIHGVVQEQTKVKDLVLRAADRTIHGVVHDPQGKPLPGVIVSAKRSGGPPFPASAVTDDKGRFALEHLTGAPTIYLFARVPGRGWIGSCTIRPGETEVVIKVGPSHYD